MKKLTLLLLIFLTIKYSSQTTVFKVENRYKQTIFKVTDVDLHYHSGVVISGFATSSFYYFINRPLLATVVGGLVGTGIGVFKEKVWDGAWHNGKESLNDMAYTSAGSFVVMLHFNICINSMRPRKEKTINPPNP